MHLITMVAYRKMTKVGRQDLAQNVCKITLLYSEAREGLDAGHNGRGRDGTGFTFLINSETEFIIVELWLIDGFFFLGDVRKENRDFHQFSTEQLNMWLLPHPTTVRTAPSEQLDSLPFLFSMPPTTIPRWGGVASHSHFDFSIEVVKLCLYIHTDFPSNPSSSRA